MLLAAIVCEVEVKNDILLSFRLDPKWGFKLKLRYMCLCVDFSSIVVGKSRDFKKKPGACSCMI